MQIEYPPPLTPPPADRSKLSVAVGNLFLICTAVVLIMSTIKIGMVMFG